jgi:PilZ domain
LSGRTVCAYSAKEYKTGRCPVGQKERRSTRRFQMRLPLKVRWTGDASVGEASSETKEVSSRGIYFFLPKDLKSGAPLEIVMTLPHEVTLAGPVKVRCLGHVVRTDAERQQDIGVAAAIERYEFLRDGEMASAN